MTEHKFTELPAFGKRGSIVYIQIAEYTNGVTVATAETEKITVNQMRKALSQEYPRLHFHFRRERFYIYGSAGKT